MREEHSAQLDHLVHKAMIFFETDRAAAWRCLRDASTLLTIKSVESGHTLRSMPSYLIGSGLAGWLARRALTYIEEHLGSKIEVGGIAEHVSLSKSHFSRAFKLSMGLPPMVYVSMRRVERAKLMMTSTGQQLIEIALACGFSDQSHFSRRFHRLIGISPGKWRRHMTARDDVKSMKTIIGQAG
jgi:transcriptional regulator GlxA family with amidase domain